MATTTPKKITRTQVEEACRVAGLVYGKKITKAVGVERLVNGFSLNPASAADFIYDYQCLVRGKVFHRSMSGEAMQHFVAQVSRDHGPAGLASALFSLRAHIEYWEGHYKKKAITFRKVLAEFERAFPISDLPDQRDLASALERDVARSLADTSEERLLRLEKASKVPRRIVVRNTAFYRNSDVIVHVLKRAGGRCERCSSSAPFIRASNSTPYLEVHHRIPLAEDGEDSIENAMAICPNCHRELHHGLQRTDTGSKRV